VRFTPDTPAQTGSLNTYRIALLKTMLVVTTLLGIGFLISQGLCWQRLYAAQVPPTANLYAYTFYTLTGLHAVHVIAGLSLLGVVTLRAFQGLYSALYHPGVRYSVMYWHFLDVVWLVLFLSLVVFG
jgi:cytochrome c oxidase subunit I+III